MGFLRRRLLGSMIKLTDLRLDLSEVAAGTKIPITVTASDQVDIISIGSGDGSGSVSGSLTTASDGLSVEAVKGSGLTCGTIEGASVTVKEGFVRAWMPMLVGPDAGFSDDHVRQDGVTGSVQIRLDVVNFPNTEGAKITWPADVEDRRDADGAVVSEGGTVIATLTLDGNESDPNGRFAIYEYKDNADDDRDDVTLSFKVTPENFENFGGAAIGVTARLWPMAKRNSDGKKNAGDLASTLSFEHAAQDSTFPGDAREGAWVLVEDCITYLLYPFVTCGATPGWTTGISVSNTSKDAGVFGVFDVSTEQSGAVVLYGFPRGTGAEPVMGMLTSDLAAGDTLTLACDQSVMAGMEGYAIIKANFQHARGMAFVLGDFADGAGVDVSHGYMAEVIDDPADRSEKLP